MFVLFISLFNVKYLFKVLFELFCNIILCCFVSSILHQSSMCHHSLLSLKFIKKSPAISM